MIYNRLKKFAREKGWYGTKKSVFGIFNNYLFNIYQGSITSSQQYKVVFCRTETMLESQILELIELLKNNKKALKYDLFEVGSDFISITFHANYIPVKTAKLDETLNFLSKELSDRNIESKYHSGDNYCNLSGEGILLNQQEFIRIASEIEQNNSMEKLEKHSYLNGFIGSLIYSLPNIILWVLVAVYLERLSTGLGLIIALAGSFGYEKFKGKLGFWTKWLLIMSNLIVIYLANITSTIFMLWRLDVPFDQMYDVLKTDLELQKYFNTNLFISMLLGIVGWLWIIFNFETKKNYLEVAQKL